MEARSSSTQPLSQGQEFRFEVASGDSVSVQLMNGMAELFGAEMALQKPYVFTGPTHEAIFTWHGCNLLVEGTCQHSYVATETPMHSYMHLHADLEQRRVAARQHNTSGPRVLIAGGHGAGKASLCRILANYAARIGDAPVLVELGVSRGAIGFPGAVAAMSLSWPLDIERGTDDAAPLAFWHGHASAQDDVALYKQRVAKLAEGVEKRLEAHPTERHSGILISGCGWIDGAGVDVLLHQIASFQADVLVVIADDRLHSQLMSHAAQLNPPPAVSPSISASHAEPILAPCYIFTMLDAVMQAPVRKPSCAGHLVDAMILHNHS